MINQYTTDVRLHDICWHEVPMSYHFQNTPRVDLMIQWCKDNNSTGLFRWHFTLKFPIYQGSFWFEKFDDSLEFRMVWL